MDKFKTVAFITGAVIISYIIILAVWVVMTGIVSDTAAVVAARPGIEQYTGAVEGLNYAPYILFVLPAVIGLIAVVIVLKRKN